jgi:hypothetical protein
MTRYSIVLLALITAAPLCSYGQSTSPQSGSQQTQGDKKANNGDAKKDDQYDVKKSGDTAHGYPPAETNTNPPKDDKSKHSSQQQPKKDGKPD